MSFRDIISGQTGILGSDTKNNSGLASKKQIKVDLEILLKIFIKDFTKVRV